MTEMEYRAIDAPNIKSFYRDPDNSAGIRNEDGCWSIVTFTEQSLIKQGGIDGRVFFSRSMA